MRKLTLAALCLAVATSAAAAELTETIDRTFDVRPGATVALDNVNGGITISAWDQPRVRVVARKKVETSRDNLKAAMAELRVDMQARDGGVVITTKNPKDGGVESLFDWFSGDRIQAQVRYELTVPRSMNLDVESVNGAISVSDVTGTHELETTNGKIEVENCAGSLDASTTNGGIDAELKTVTKGQPLRFSTTNGAIAVALPSNLAVDVDAGTTNGSIKSDLPVATTKFSRNSLRGTINGGGTPLRLRTTNGSIKISTVN